MIARAGTFSASTVATWMEQFRLGLYIGLAVGGIVSAALAAWLLRLAGARWVMSGCRNCVVQENALHAVGAQVLP